MPKKGEKLTEEHKQAMEEGRRKALEQERAEVEAHEEATEELEAKRAQEQQEALDRAEEERRKMIEEIEDSPVVAQPGPPVHAPTYNPRTQGVQEWGPYAKYEIVQTPYGQYAVEVGYVMMFEEYEFFDDREKRMRKSHRPVYVWHGTGPDDKDYGKTRDELVRGLRKGERHPPKVVVPTS